MRATYNTQRQETWTNEIRTDSLTDLLQWDEPEQASGAVSAAVSEADYPQQSTESASAPQMVANNVLPRVSSPKASEDKPSEFAGFWDEAQPLFSSVGSSDCLQR